MFRLLKIRQLQFNRALNGLGVYVPLVFAAMLVMLYVAYKIFENTNYGYTLIALVGFALISIHLKRADKKFVEIHLSNTYWLNYFEYAALTLPIAIVALLAKNWWSFMLLILIVFFIPLIKINYRRFNFSLPFIGKWLPNDNFEWIAGVRKYFIYLLPLYVFALAFCWLRIFPFLILWFISIFVASFYQYCEPLRVLRDKNYSSSEFLRNKLGRHIGLWLLFCLPVFILSTALLPEEWLINLMFVVTLCVFITFVILFKYSSYQPNLDLQAQGVIVSVIGLLSVLPFLLPVPFLLSVIYYFKARKNLNHYLA